MAFPNWAELNRCAFFNRSAPHLLHTIFVVRWLYWWRLTPPQEWQTLEQSGFREPFALVRVFFVHLNTLPYGVCRNFEFAPPDGARSRQPAHVHPREKRSNWKTREIRKFHVACTSIMCSKGQLIKSHCRPYIYHTRSPSNGLTHAHENRPDICCGVLSVRINSNPSRHSSGCGKNAHVHWKLEHRISLVCFVVVVCMGTICWAENPITNRWKTTNKTTFH